MKVLHLNTYGRFGGAALGTLYLHQGLRAIGVESEIVCRDGSDEADRFIVKGCERRMASTCNLWLNRLVGRLFPRMRPGFSYVGVGSLDLKGALRRAKPDILHVHWITDGFLNPQDLLRIGVPVVVTLRDFWFLTGGCHYPEGCGRLVEGCGKCPLLGSSRVADLSRLQFAFRKRERESGKLQFVAISEWMKGAIDLFSPDADDDIRVIPNCVPLDSFSPRSKADCRRHLGLPEEAHVVFFPSLYPWSDRRKGGHLLLDALERLNPPHRERLLICSDGQLPLAVQAKHSFQIVSMERANGAEAMSLRYGAADVVVVPSLEEAFGKVTAEAIACCRPVVAFDRTGAADIIKHRINGFLAVNGSVESLVEGLIWAYEEAMADGEKLMSLRNSAVTRFSPEIVARSYESLYTSMLAR